MKKKISELRQEYKSEGLRRADVQADPFEQFEQWLDVAIDAQLVEPNSFSLGTVGVDGAPNSRMVLLKDLSADGFSFFTNYESQKALEIENNPNVAMLFPWVPLERQVRVLGVAQKVSSQESFKYFRMRPLGAQLGAWASKQSQVVGSRSDLELEFQRVKERFEGEEVPLPPSWGGYRVKPHLFEFWQGRADRLHDRIRYKLVEGQWIIERLSP